MNYDIGIGITTRNRIDVLTICISFFYKYKYPSDFDIVVVDDNSDLEVHAEVIKLQEQYNFKLIYNEERLGIAKSKNVCLNNLHNQHVFLFDDDTFPSADCWFVPFIYLFENFNITHSMYINDYPYMVGGESKILSSGDYNVFSMSQGLCLYFHRIALNILKGYNDNFGYYGFEHAEISQRAYKMGLTPYEYISPTNIEKYIYAIDFDYNWRGVSPEGISLDTKNICSSMGADNIDKLIEENRQVYLNL